MNLDEQQQQAIDLIKKAAEERGFNKVIAALRKHGIQVYKPHVVTPIMQASEWADWLVSRKEEILR